jgi:hypothetical protein
VTGDKIPFSQFEQIAVNAMEQAFFVDLVPGNAKQGKKLLPGFSLVNCRLFARALTSALSEGGGEDQGAILSLLNEMRPTMLELDANWDNLMKKYPEAGAEPYVPASISKADIEDAIRNKMLATDEDISNVEKELREMGKSTGWQLMGTLHASVFTDEGLDRSTDFVRVLLENIGSANPAAKFTLLEPLEELF